MRAVELSEEAPEQFGAFRQLQIGPEKGPPVHEPPFAHEQQAERKAALRRNHARDVHVAAFGQDHALAFHGALNGLDLIAVDGGLLVFHRFRGFGHGAAQGVHQLARTPGQQQFHAVYEGGVVFRRHVFGTRREALSDVVVEAGADAVLEGPVRTAPQGEGPVDGLPRFAGRLPRGERSEIAGVVAPGLAHHLKTRKGHVLGDAEQHVLLVVAQNDVVVRAVLFDQAGFEQERFLFRGGGKRLQRGGVADHGHRFGRERPYRGKRRA